MITIRGKGIDRYLEQLLFTAVTNALRVKSAHPAETIFFNPT